MPARAGAFALLVATGLSVAGCATAPIAQRADTLQAEAGGVAGESALLTLAGRMADAGRPAAAVALYKRALGTGADRHAARAGLARALMGLGDYARAHDVLDEADAEDSGHPGLLMALGEASLAFGDAAAALGAYRAASAAGADARAESGQAVALDLLGRHGEALAAHERAVTRGGGDINLRSNLALSLILHDDAARGAALMAELAAAPDATAQHRQNLALAYIFADQEDKARRMARVDLDAQSATRTLGYFRMLHAMPPTERMRALVVAAQSPVEPSQDSAVLAFTETPARQQSAAEIIKQTPEPQPEPEPEPEPETVRDTAGLPPLVDPEGWSVQIAAYRRTENFLKGQAQYWARFNDILGPVEPRRSEVDFGDRAEPPRGFFYRLNAGPLKDRAEAVALCAAMSEAGGPCWIRPPEPAEGRLPGSSGGD